MDYTKACDLADEVSPAPATAHEALQLLRGRCRELEAKIAADPWREAIRDACGWAGVDVIADSPALTLNNLVKTRANEAIAGAGDNAVLGFAAGMHELLAGVDGDSAIMLPDDWYEKPIARFQYHIDAGDPSVGIDGSSGWVLAEDQSGTVLAGILQDTVAGAIQEA